jgi:PKD repeat protein
MMSFCSLNVKTREGRVNKMRTQSIALALLAGLVFSVAAIAAPSFTDQDIDNGYVNPKDNVVVQKVKIVDGASTINSVWIRNLGSADGSDITKLVIDNDADPFTDPIKSYTALTNLRSGMTLSLGYTVPNGTTYLWIGVEIASTAHDNRNIQLKVQFFSGGYTSPYITDGSAETIFKGGFEKKSDVSPSAGYLNPGDGDVLVQKATFTDDDGNTVGVGISKVSVSNTEDADNTDITDVKVEIVVGATTYTAHKVPSAADWGSGNPLEFTAAELGLPGTFDDEASISVRVRVTAGGTTDKRKIKTLLVLRTNENAVAYDQSVLAGKTQTIRIQGFESTRDVSADIPSGVLVPSDKLVQKVTATDDDVNGSALSVIGIWIKNNGDATEDDIKSIVVKKGAIPLLTLDQGDIVDFNSGHLYVVADGFHATAVTDDESVTLTIEYTIDGTITDGHTLQPKVYVKAEEPSGGTAYSSDAVTYPKSIVIHPHGLESVVNVAMADGTAYSGQRLLAQKITCNDLDENTDSVKLNPINVKNIASSRCADSEVAKIEVRTESGALLGETTSVAGLGAGGIAISTLQNNVVADDGSLTLFVYVTFAGPEAITAGHKLKLETTVFSQEDGHAGENSATGADWTLAINHRPTCDFDYTPAADLTYQTEITFTAKDVNDEDGDAIKSYSWTFSDGGAGTGTSTKHTFAAGGSVWAKLTVEDARGLTGWKQKTLDVTTPPVVPVAKFSWAPETPGAGDEVTFTDKSTTPTSTTITKWSWDFDNDGTEDSTEQNPTHTYSAGGTYTVSLTVTNSDAQTDTVTHDVEVPALKPTADFYYSSTTPDVGDEVSTKNPKHTYTAMGAYPVSLTVTDSEDQTSNAYTEQVIVGPAVMVYSYPNPASDAVTFAYRVPDGAKDLKLSIFNITGALVYEADLAAGETEHAWELASTADDPLPNGLYLCVVVAKNATGGTLPPATFKLLIQR